MTIFAFKIKNNSNMEVKKILFISQEIEPYVPERRLSVIGRLLPQGVKEQGIEERTFMPKYGMIAERSNQLHEMIRLSGMNVIIDDTDHPLIIKVATLQQAHFQVYFIYNEDYFASNRIDELEMNCSPDDNDERSMFFVRAVIESIRKMRWVPDIIQCTGWISALAPVYIRTLYGDDPSFRDAKIVTALFNESIPKPLGDRLADKMHQDGIPKNALKPINGKELISTPRIEIHSGFAVPVENYIIIALDLSDDGSSRMILDRQLSAAPIDGYDANTSYARLIWHTAPNN